MFRNSVDNQQNKQDEFTAQMKFWHAKHGPAMPQEMVNETMIMRSSAFDFTKEQAGLYPQTLFVRVGNQYAEVNTKSAYCFVMIRKKLMYAWQVDETGPKIDPDWSEGIEQRPLDITDLGVSLQDFKLLTMLLDDEDHKNVLNLTGEQVNSLDESVKKLKMDSYRYLYNGRSRLNDESGTQLEVVLYGKNVSTKDVSGPYKYNNIIDNEGFSYIESLIFTLPTALTAILYHKAQFEEPGNTFLRIFNIMKDNVSVNVLTDYTKDKWTKKVVNTVENAERDIDARIAAQLHFKTLFQIEELQAGVESRYCTYSGGSGDSTLKQFILTLHMDFPYGHDIEEEKRKLEATCKALKEIALKSRPQPVE